MKVKIIVIILLGISLVSKAQDYTESWIGHFSYLEISDVSKGATKLYASAENSVFVYDFETKEIDKLSSINGLSGETISTIKYVETENLVLIGFENGLIQIYDEINQSIISVVDILEKTIIPPNNKSINHFNIHNGLAYIATDFGVSVYDLQNLEFGDTYYIGSNGTQIVINQTTIFGDYIYTASPTGVRKGLLSNTNLIDYQEWETVFNGNWLQIESLNDVLYATRSNKRLYDISNDSLITLIIYLDTPLDLRAVNNKLIVTTRSEVFVYDEFFAELAYATENEVYDNTRFSSATINENNELFIGTNAIDNIGKPGYGILKSTFDNPTDYEEIYPSGPLKNFIFKIEATSSDIYLTHGGHSISFNPNTGFRKAGISHYFNESWNNIPYDSLTLTTTNPWSLSYISINPVNNAQAFISSSRRGLVEINDNQAITLFNGDNSTIIPFTGPNLFTHASTYDSNGSLWVMNSRVDTSINKYENEQWQSFSLGEIIGSPTSNLGFGDIEQDEQGNFFIGSHQYGVIGFNENNGNPIFKNLVGEDNNLPSPSVRSIAVDNSGQIWVGTGKGLRIIYNANAFMTDNQEVDEIIIVEDGTPKELLFQQFITDIEVDGSNNKWIATLDTGVYYLSSDGQETILHFTKDNSPLPSNNVLDVSIDNVNGLVYMATDKGLLAYKSDGSKPQETLNNAYVFPNPVRPNFNIAEEKIKIRDISENLNIKITDIEGNLVAEAETNTNSRFKGYNLEIDGGTALWNGKNLSGREVATGVYLVMLSDLETLETKVLKVMVVR
ncbi:type IX secretion system anionic LPS delivery protein PorZ [Lacinutrix salivirga]